jgi:hypothetical protein
VQVGQDVQRGEVGGDPRPLAGRAEVLLAERPEPLYSLGWL